MNMCLRLKNITIPPAVTEIGGAAFACCTDAVLTVTRDSYAEQYAKENGFEYGYPDTED